MATFVNQTSNLSALSAALESFSSVLDTNDESHSYDSLQDRREQAQIFLASQRERVTTIDKHLFNAAGAVIPPHKEMKTATELAELCRLVQERTRRKLNVLANELSSRGVDIHIPWTEETETTIESPEMPQQQSFLQFSIGGPLESVIEGDLETEGATTPGSLIQPSPFYSGNRQRKKSITPPTPTMDTFSFSAGTNDLINTVPSTTNNIGGAIDSQQRSSIVHGNDNTPNSNKWSNRSTRPLDRQLHFDEFQDEDDMITLESRSTLAAKSPAHRSPANEEKSQFLARMEVMLERVEESVLESRPSDETDRTRQFNKSTSILNSSQGSVDGRSEIDDDSTNVVATQIAATHEDGAVKQRRLHSPGRNPENIARGEGSSIQRPAHIFVDTAASSPTHTNITMDMTMVNETFGGMSILADDDNSSIITPILDRYRLDPDDNSVGIKVVPNRRGAHGKRRESVGARPRNWNSTTENRKEVFYTSPDGIRSPVGIPSTVSARKKKRKKQTPFRKHKSNHDNLENTSDENTNPNARAERKIYRKTPFPKKQPADDSSSLGSIYSMSPKKILSASGSNSFSIPPLRPRSLEPTRGSASRTPTSRSASLPAAKNSKSPMSDAFIAKHFSGPYHEQPAKSPKQLATWIERITMAEYERAPSIVRTQVRRDEANISLDVLEQFLKALKNKDSQPIEFTEKQGFDVLRDVLSSDQKRKSVLMSLCHWRRLLMFRDKTNGMIFRVNQFDEAA